MKDYIENWSVCRLMSVAIEKVSQKEKKKKDDLRKEKIGLQLGGSIRT